MTINEALTKIFALLIAMVMVMAMGVTAMAATNYTLTATGGIGTTIFYIVGAILVIGAGVVLETRRRMNVQ